MLGRITEGLGDACYVRPNLRGSWREGFGCTCYVRSISGAFVMLAPIAEALFLSCYVRSISGHFVMLGAIFRHLLC